jgi:hypothetical protein
VLKEFWIDQMRVWLSPVLACICFGCGWFLAADFPSFVGAVWVLLGVWTAALIFSGIALYMVRRGARLVYGIVETIGGVGAIVAAVMNTIRLRITQPEETIFAGQNAFVGYFLLAASIYVLVRGLDNIGEGLSEGSTAQKKWNAVFPKNR